MTGKLSGNIRVFLLALLMISGAGSTINGQVHSIFGTINKYAHVSAVGTDNVILPDAIQFSYFHAGDTVLLIQMKGVEILVEETGNYGTYASYDLGTPGAYEFLTVLSVESGTGKITFRNNISKTYDPLGDVQLIRVPSYISAKVEGSDLTCQPWDSASKTGGVLAVIVGTKLTLNANISVSGKGFLGGAAAIGLGNCASLPGNNYFSYPFSFQNSGVKGESQASKGYVSATEQYPIFPLYAKGTGSNYTGGGGGNGVFSGGAGGGHIGDGGKGGKESNICTAKYGGVGGGNITTDGLTGLFMGGGGGGSTYFSGATTSNGGRGGGIAFILCETLDGNSKTISADGEQPADASGNAGSGGGGAGGTVALYLQSFATNVNLNAKGGHGGNNGSNNYGEGGGGGGGRVTVSTSTGPGVATSGITGGQPGQHNPPPSTNAIAGGDGESNTTFVPLLNGFLFNTIKSSVTQNQVDSICSNVVPPVINGTNPVGGSGTYTYVWQKKYSLAGTASAIAGASSRDYTPIATEANTFWVRRIVKDESTLLTDTSKWVKMIVQPAITGNLVGKDTTICSGQDPKKLYPLNSGPSNGNGHYSYQWFANTDNATWTVNATGTSTLSYYDPSALTNTTYYKRYVTSGRCVDLSSAVTITVLPSITGNVTLRPDSVICQGSLFNTLGATAAGGGSGSYLYQWQQSTDASTWISAPNTSTNSTYTVDTVTFTPLAVENMYYRRVVYSGLNNTCQSNSVPIHMTRYHKIGNNSIAADQTICSGSVPAALSGSSPTYGAGVGSYTYLWQDSSQAATWATRSILPGTSYAPAALTTTTWYRRIVNSSKCTNTSKKIKIIVDQPVVGNTIGLLSGPGPDTTVCNGATPHRIKGPVATSLSGGTGIAGDFAFQWSSSTDGTIFTDIASGGTLADYQPGALTATTWFRRKAQSGMCSSISGSIRVIVLPLIAGNTITTAKNTVCYGLVPTSLTTSGTVTGGSGTYTWLWQESNDGTTFNTASGTSTNETYSPPALTAKKWYRRIVNSGLSNCCTSMSNVISIDILTLPTATITTTSDTTLCSTGKVRLNLTLTGASGWTVKYNEGATQVTEPTISSASATILRTPGSSGSPATLLYSIASVIDANGCSATSMSGTRKAFVYTQPLANAGSNYEICGRKFTLAAVPSAGTGLWTFPSRAHTPDPTLPGAVISIDTFNTAFDTITFFWKETNWTCVSSSKVKVTFDNQVDVVEAGTGGSVMTFDNSILVKASPILSFESGKWTVETGDGHFVDDTSDSTYVRDVPPGTNSYRWTVTNRLCSRSDIVVFDVSAPVVPEGISPDGNGLNDTLHITGLDYYTQDIDLKIINGAGALVFSATWKAGADNSGSWSAWAGNDMKGNPLPEGTYYYLIKVYTPETKHTAMAKGFIILKRH